MLRRTIFFAALILFYTTPMFASIRASAYGSDDFERYFIAAIIINFILAAINGYWKNAWVTLVNAIMILPCFFALIAAFASGLLYGLAGAAVFIAQIVLMFKSGGEEP